MCDDNSKATWKVVKKELGYIDSKYDCRIMIKDKVALGFLILIE